MAYFPRNINFQTLLLIVTNHAFSISSQSLKLRTWDRNRNSLSLFLSSLRDLCWEGEGEENEEKRQRRLSFVLRRSGSTNGFRSTRKKTPRGGIVGGEGVGGREKNLWQGVYRTHAASSSS